MREETNIEYRYSGAFWMKKLLWLLGMLLAGIAIWWLWNWSDDADTTSNNDTGNITAVQALDTDNDGEPDTEDEDDDGDGYTDAVELEEGTNPLLATSFPDLTDGDGDGFSDMREKAAGSDPEDVDSTPENVQTVAVTENPYSYADADGNDVEPTVNGCVYTYQINATTTVAVAHDCDDLDAMTRDWTWNHVETTDSFSLTSTPVEAWCVVEAGSLCSSGNGVLEVFVEPVNATGEYTKFLVKDTAADADETNGVSLYTPIIESFKITQ